MIVDFLYALRERKVPVGAQEAVALAGALSKGLHDSSLDGFYHVARSLLVHSEAHLDDFDVAFAWHFRGVAPDAVKITDELLEWLRDPRRMRELTPEERAALEALDLEEVRRRFEQRLREQRERHDGGNRWIGTAGTAPFGRGGTNPAGIRVGEGSGGRSALQSADARRYRPYRSDLVLDVRQTEVALRKLRAFTREGGLRELDLEETIDRTARNAGELEVVTRPPRRPDTRVLLVMDVGGSMDPYADLVSQIFSAARRATHWRELRTYYFHNCVYGRLYRTDRFDDPVPVHDVLRECGPHHKLVMVGDALMAPYELLGTAGWTAGDGTSGLAWLTRLRDHFDRAIWLNPESPRDWSQETIALVASVLPMFPLTLEGLGEGIGELMRGRRKR